jgi:hypothetical protein
MNEFEQIMNEKNGTTESDAERDFREFCEYLEERDSDEGDEEE